ncbi:hypothetical protein BLNAU_15966 [Blattamonas nauphoetae]|uniref:Uncharacterized protein n=1 Tax=Blattamonas nauphoetae TaxID=2049346 RepID=A0ABQ9XD07_9EUKA|nr:hypothetical protein BLNAU_15966 [Blattamonas nauphoetae]
MFVLSTWADQQTHKRMEKEVQSVRKIMAGAIGPNKNEPILTKQEQLAKRRAELIIAGFTPEEADSHLFREEEHKRISASITKQKRTKPERDQYGSFEDLDLPQVSDEKSEQSIMSYVLTHQNDKFKKVQTYSKRKQGDSQSETTPQDSEPVEELSHQQLLRFGEFDGNIRDTFDEFDELYDRVNLFETTTIPKRKETKATIEVQLSLLSSEKQNLTTQIERFRQMRMNTPPQEGSSKQKDVDPLDAFMETISNDIESEEELKLKNRLSTIENEIGRLTRELSFVPSISIRHAKPKQENLKERLIVPSKKEDEKKHTEIVVKAKPKKKLNIQLNKFSTASLYKQLEKETDEEIRIREERRATEEKMDEFVEHQKEENVEPQPSTGPSLPNLMTKIQMQYQQAFGKDVVKGG